MENRTIYANSGGMSSITSPIAIKDSVTSFHWSDYILETHSDAIESLLQCQSIAVFEGWHYTVYDETLQTCYFGMVKTDKTVLEISDDSNRYITLALFEMSFETKLSFNTFPYRQVSINTAELSGFVSDTFVTRTSNIYQPYTYSQFVYPMNVEHCSIHCYFDPNNECDFFYILHSYCWLGYYNEDAPIGAYGDWVTAYIKKGIYIYKQIVSISLTKVYS